MVNKKMSVIIPGLQWYLEQSAFKNISPRCPFATVQSCPRFYQSLSLLGDAGSTKIPQKEDKKLLKKWKKSPFWPTTKEQATSISGYEDNHFWNFCPEVSFERFGLFATDLDRYADEIDKDFAHSKLSKRKVTSDDWRWFWSNIQSQHYSECPLYSVLLSSKSDSHNNYEDIIELKPTLYGVSLNVNALFRKIVRLIKR
ncbi:MAG: hypothetical protein AABZ54_05205 [Bacteroidota bacterium]